MKPDEANGVYATIPGLFPDNRVVAGQSFHPAPMLDLTRGAQFIRGIVTSLDRDGVSALREIAAQTELKQLVLVIAIYGGSRTWDDVLIDLLSLQDTTLLDRGQFRLLARRIGPDRPANLLWVQRGDGEPGHIVTGNVGNLLTGDRWDPTDLVVAFPVEAASADALRKWFDNLHAHSRPLTPETAAAPRLRPPEGDAEGERLWREYLELLDHGEDDAPIEVVVNEETGEVERAVDPTPSKTNTFPSIDPVLAAVQVVLAKGSVVALDQTSRAPPLSAPIKPELFGERGETRSGAARRRQSFSVSLFDESVTRRLDARKTAMTQRLAACSMMLRDGVRWVPDAADELLAAEFNAVEKEAASTLKAAIGEKSAKQFVDDSVEKIANDCKALASLIAPGRQLPANLIDTVKADLTFRLGKNLEQGMTPGISRSRYQILLAESDREGPWDQVLNLLLSAARLPREIITDPRRRFGLVTKTDDLIAAFNVFDDPLVARYLDGNRVDIQAQTDLELIKAIQDHPSAKSKQRAQALLLLIKGQPHEAVNSALAEEKATE